jgi:S1-C subfamily serine protease
LLLPASVHAADGFPPAGDDANPPAEKSQPAIVRVESGDEGFLLAGTGFFIDDQGTVLTSSTVIGDNTSVRVTVNGIPMDAKILGNDPRSGLAMLKVSYADSPSLTLGHSGDLKTGDGVVAIGYPLNLPAVASPGPICGFDIGTPTHHFCTTHIHASVPISPGEVGGPLLGAHGEVVGMVVPSLDDGSTVYALPVEAMEKIMADFTAFGRAKHGWVGVTVVEVPDTQRDGRTVQVVEAVPGTPASRSGIRPGDTVMRIDSREVYRPADVLDASFFSHVGNTMNVVVRRQQSLYNYSFAVIERPQSPPATVTIAPRPIHVAKSS